jgi:copine 1/2/3
MVEYEKRSEIKFTVSAELPESGVSDERLCYAVMELRNSPAQPWVPIRRTASIRMSTELIWSEEFELHYKFQCQQDIRVSVFRLEEGEPLLVGHGIYEVNKLLASENRLRITDGDGSDSGLLILRCEEIVETKQKIVFELKGERLDDLDYFDKSDPFVRLFRETSAGWVMIYESKVVFDNLNPQWDPVALDYAQFCSCNPNIMIRAECYDWDSATTKELIGIAVFSAGSFRTGASFSLINPEKLTSKAGYIDSGRLIVTKAELVKENSFIDYLRGGMCLNISLGIDFTASNGLPSNNNSLHFCSEGVHNEYETAIHVLGQILSSYDSDNRFSVFGFGGKPHGSAEVQHAFPLNDSEISPFVEGFGQVIALYREALPRIELKGPTFFAPLIRRQMRLVSVGQEKTYHILLIITDGEVDDFDDTVEALVEASRLPMSVLIVGVGYENFVMMEKLDGDQKEIVSKSGHKCARDIVQFVKFRKYKHDLELFSKEALMEIPTQLMNYMKIRGCDRVQIRS